ncbi:hypothetical protein ACFRCI_18740 [Streptomyces sp. NPDC056638]|uniref:hypothetical protein n=1 Tax=Streptomyces sp. NPDC056638 TaxID=3345887 RepID=UPI0036CB5193
MSPFVAGLVGLVDDPFSGRGSGPHLKQVHLDRVVVRAETVLGTSLIAAAGTDTR